MRPKSDPDKSVPQEDPTDREAERLDYIRQMAMELRTLAFGAGAPTLAYLLEMSALEAAEITKAHAFQADLQAKR
jgi:hypothetical protein